MKTGKIMWNQNIKKAKLNYMDTNSFVIHTKAENLYVYVAKHVGTRCDTSSYKSDKPFPRRK